MQPPQDFQQQFPPLPEIKSEFNSISQAIVSTTELLNRDFNSKNLENKVNAVPFNVLHLATHGQFSSRTENTFILAADGPINVMQFDSLLRRRDETRSQALEMLVLSACETAILIGEFYRELVKTKVTKAEALRRAQVKLLKDYPNYSRPSYWAPYVLVGNWL